MTFGFSFPSPPPLETTLNYTRGRTIKLIDVQPYTRADGRLSQVLVWECSDGQRGTSGLASRAVTFGKGAA